MARKKLKHELWEPRDAAGRLALIKHLDTELPKLKRSLNIPQGDLDKIHKIYLMGKYLMDGGREIEKSKKEFNATKNDFFVGKTVKLMIKAPLIKAQKETPETVEGNVMGYLRSLRIILMKHKNWTEAIAKYLKLLGSEYYFDKDKYLPKLKGKASIGNIRITTSTKFVKDHNLYARITGTEFWIYIGMFETAYYNYARIPVTPNTVEEVDLMIMGVVNNVEIGKPSVTYSVLYKPAQTEKPVKNDK